MFGGGESGLTRCRVFSDLMGSFLFVYGPCFCGEFNFASHGEQMVGADVAVYFSDQSRAGLVPDELRNFSIGQPGLAGLGNEVGTQALRRDMRQTASLCRLCQAAAIGRIVAWY